MREVLLVEDNPELNEINRRALLLSGYRVHAVKTLAAARAWLLGNEPDVILLDILLPDGNGIDFCGEIRGGTSAHILFLTSRTEHVDRIRGLTSGGDDYIVKPYRLDELMARVDAAMRRRAMSDQARGARISRGPLSLDLQSGRAFFAGEDLNLSTREFTLLLVFLRAGDRPMTKEELYETAWNQPMAGDDNAIKICVSRLRGKLKRAGSEWTIAMTRGEGYSFQRLSSAPIREEM